jgi:hypothetical protein
VLSITDVLTFLLKKWVALRLSEANKEPGLSIVVGMSRAFITSTAQ